MRRRRISMDDETTPSASNEEPTPTRTPEVAVAAEDNLPSAVTPTEIATEATQTMITETTPDEMATVTIIPDISAEPTQVAPVAAVPTAYQSPQAYEQFGTPTQPTHVATYPNMVTLPPQSSSQVLTNAPQSANLASYTNPDIYKLNTAYIPQPGQPSFAPAPVQASMPRKRGTLVWMILIALVAFLLGNGSVLAYMAIQQAQISSPNVTLHKYCDGVNTANAQEIYDTLSQQEKQNVSMADIQRTFDAFNFLNSSSSTSSIKFGNCVASNIHISGSLAVATVTISLEMTLQGQTTSLASPTLVSLVLEDQQWKVDFSNLTQSQPDLNVPGLPSTPGSSN